MKIKIYAYLLVIISICLTLGCSVVQKLDTTTKNKSPYNFHSLHNAFKPYFDIGAAVNTRQIKGEDLRSLSIIDAHFNVLTAENDMKWENIQPKEGQFDFTKSDALIRYAKSTHKKVIGHTLLWHYQTPDWLFVDSNGQPASRELMLKRLKSHIFALAGRYKNDIYGWDVVNEAFNDDGSMRESKWYQLIGADYIEKAFEFANQAAPNAQLYYNDYNLFKPEKMDAVIQLVKRLKRKGIRIDAIGEQAHYDSNPPIELLRESFDKVINTGLNIMITELDVSVLKFPNPENMGADLSVNFELQDEYNPYANKLSPDAKEKQAQAFKDLFTLFLQYHEHLNRVTMWGVSDIDSWKNDWPISGRTDYPLLFDRQYRAKPFINDLINMARMKESN